MLVPPVRGALGDPKHFSGKVVNDRFDDGPFDGHGRLESEWRLHSRLGAVLVHKVAFTW